MSVLRVVLKGKKKTVIKVEHITSLSAVLYASFPLSLSLSLYLFVLLHYAAER